jgi:hypothetical protein
MRIPTVGSQMIGQEFILNKSALSNLKSLQIGTRVSCVGADALATGSGFLARNSLYPKDDFYVLWADVTPVDALLETKWSFERR